IGRWWAGRRGDRTGHPGRLVPALVIASLGMITMIGLASPAAVIAGMCLFGIGFGIGQNATFALMIERVPASGLGTASALWNLAYDAGYGAGPIVFGLLVGHTGYPAAFALTAVLMLAVLPAARRERSAAATGSRRGPPSFLYDWVTARYDLFRCPNLSRYTQRIPRVSLLPLTPRSTPDAKGSRR